jgi:ornithine decarboxylase
MDKARFVVSRDRLIDQYGLLKGMCPRISYSLKTNPEVGKLLEEHTSCFFSIHTVEGLRDVRDMKRVWFLAEAIDRGGLSFLLDKGITRFVVDNESDLEVLLETIKERESVVDLLLRMRFQETTVHRGRFFLFGFTTERINQLIPELRRNRLIRNLGIHFHRKSQNTGNWSLREMLEEALSEDTLRQTDLMNIGGGIPVDYMNSRAANLDYIASKISELDEWLARKDIKMIMEPGRSLAAPPTTLEASINSIWGRNITVNCSVYNSSMDTIIVPLKLLVKGEGEGRSYIIKGCTPCSMDIFRYDVKLRNPGVGERLVFLNAGAYNFASDFCNLPRLETVVE